MQNIRGSEPPEIQSRCFTRFHHNKHTLMRGKLCKNRNSIEAREVFLWSFAPKFCSPSWYFLRISLMSTQHLQRCNIHAPSPSQKGNVVWVPTHKDSGIWILEKLTPPNTAHCRRDIESQEASGKKVWRSGDGDSDGGKGCKEEIAIPATYKVAVASHPFNTMGNCKAIREIAGTSTMHLSKRLSNMRLHSEMLEGENPLEAFCCHAESLHPKFAPVYC